MMMIIKIADDEFFLPLMTLKKETLGGNPKKSKLCKIWPTETPCPELCIGECDH